MHQRHLSLAEEFRLPPRFDRVAVLGEGMPNRSNAFGVPAATVEVLHSHSTRLRHAPGPTRSQSRWLPLSRHIFRQALELLLCGEPATHLPRVKTWLVRDSLLIFHEAYSLSEKIDLVARLLLIKFSWCK